MLAILIASTGIGVTALLGGSGIASADPDDDMPAIIDDFLFTPIFTQDPQVLRPGKAGGVEQDWGRIGMVCQNRTVKCQKNGF
ncbi:hypothetical protein [Mycobacterium pseudokansasii]|uniref:hypothetical protein n=1 Tax=Mycobacterium pseudokansasii TaxID=2341080 RepID=UPI001FCEC641|nr:hypothetical protein [Mycobacterium pseudokansasii]